MRGEIRPPLQVAESLYRGQELRGVHRERRVGRARVPGDRTGVVRRAGHLQLGSGARGPLPAAGVRQQSDHPGEPAVQRQSTVGGPERVRRCRIGPVRLGPGRHGTAAAPVRVPRIYIRAGHHHVRVHPELQAVSRVRFQERRRGRAIAVVVVAIRQRRRYVFVQERRGPEVRRGPGDVQFGVLLRTGDRGPAQQAAVVRHPLEPERREQERLGRRRRPRRHDRRDCRVVQSQQQQQ